MNIKKIILEEVGAFEWANDIPLPSQFQIGGFEYSNGNVIPWGVTSIGQSVIYRYHDRTSFIVEKMRYDGVVYDKDNIDDLPSSALNHNDVWAINLWSSEQPQPYLDRGGLNWYDGNKAEVN